MSQNSLAKHGYRIRTRSGVIVDNLQIYGRNPQEAQQKLMRMYPGCTVLETREVAPTCNANAGSSFEDVVDLLTASS
ncbi:MAG: hypothetical protein HXY26_10565 [Hydrogenophilaceae bacterium]|nr:hypothetical protein [Hydrogenophilaceae bacterium]